VTNDTKCPNCKKTIAHRDVFCPACKHIQPPSQADYFSKLGVAHDFEIGAKNLEVAYFALQRQLHPDLFINKSEKEKSLSMQQTMDINKAYETLKSPLSRAEYLLSLQGIIVNKDNSSSLRPSPEILMESLDAREALENANTPEENREIAVRTADERIACIDTIKAALSAGELEKAAQNTIRLRYIEKLTEEIKKK
jgi:molecular chaperone HscB